MLGSSTQKYWPGRNSTSSPRRSKTTSSVCFATSSLTLIRERTLDADRCEEDEDDRRHCDDAVQGDDRDREALLRRRCSRRHLGRRLGRGWAPLPALVPDREHRPAEERHDDERREGDPRERVD